MAVPQKLYIELPHDPATPLFGTYPNESKAGFQTDTCTPTFTAALFTKAKRWEQPKYPLTDE